MKWEILSSYDKDFVLQAAISKGWAENKVQVKRYRRGNKYAWVIEPYEETCRCPNIIKYEEYLGEGLGG